MLKKTLLAAAALAFIALGATSPASAHDRNGNWDNGQNWENGRNWNNRRNGKNYDNNRYNYGYIQKPHYKQYGYWQYRPYPWWLQYNWQPRWY